jgi:hypothetical protein
MWSKRFLALGMAGAAVTAVLALGLIWALMATVGVAKGFPLALLSFLLPSVIGILVYPLCWWQLIYRKRDYGVRRTLLLVVVTYLWCCAVVAVALMAWSIQLLLTGQLSLDLSGVPVAGIALILIGALLFVVPFVAVATPLAFLQRTIVLRIFRNEPDRAA